LLLLETLKTLKGLQQLQYLPVTFPLAAQMFQPKPSIIFTYQILRHLIAMFALLESSEDIVKNALGLLAKIIANIVSNPMEEKFRRIGRNNAAFSKKLGAVPGGTSCMEALGFRLVQDDWILDANAEAWDNLVACQTKLNRFNDNLQQSSPARSNSSADSKAEVVAPSTAPVPDPSVPTAVNTSPPQGQGPPLDPTAAAKLLQALLTLQSGLSPTSTADQPPPPASTAGQESPPAVRVLAFGLHPSTEP